MVNSRCFSFYFFQLFYAFWLYFNEYLLFDNQGKIERKNNYLPWPYESVIIFMHKEGIGFSLK